MKEELKQNLKESTTWMRILHMILFAVIYWVVKFVIAVIIIFQVFAVLITRKPNDALLDFGQSLSTFVYQIILFLTYNSNLQPYPFSPWPKGKPEDQPAIEASTDETVSEEPSAGGNKEESE